MTPFDPRLLRTVPGTRRPVLVLGALGIVQGAATVATAFALTAVVVAVVRQTDLREPATWLLALFAVRALVSWTSERVAAWAGTTVATELREQVLAAWLRRDADSRPERARALTLATQGATTVEPYVAKYLPALITATVVPPLAIITLFVVDWPSALVVLLTVPLLPVFAALIGLSTSDDTRRRWQTLSDLAGHFLDVVRGLPTLVSYGRGERQIETIRSVSERHRLATMRTLRLAFLSSAALELLATLAVAIVAVLTGLRLTHGSMDLASAMVAILLAPEAYWPIRRVGAEFHSAADGAEALEDVLTELEAVDEPIATHLRVEPGSGEPLLIASDVTYAYPETARPVLRDVSLSAGRGLTVLTGPSGVGKTTLLEVLAGIRRPTAGEVTRAGDVHLVSQRPFLGAGTVRANLTLGTTADDSEADTALRTVGLADVVAALPDGLDSLLGDDGFGLSAGQRARLVLARALLSDAPVILLDEPTAHLDPESADLVHRVITDLARERTVVAVTHRSDLMALADQHVVLAAPDPATATPDAPTSHAPVTPLGSAATSGAAR